MPAHVWLLLPHWSSARLALHSMALYSVVLPSPIHLQECLPVERFQSHDHELRLNLLVSDSATCNACMLIMWEDWRMYCACSWCQVGMFFSPQQRMGPCQVHHKNTKYLLENFHIKLHNTGHYYILFIVFYKYQAPVRAPGIQVLPSASLTSLPLHPLKANGKWKLAK